MGYSYPLMYKGAKPTSAAFSQNKDARNMKRKGFFSFILPFWNEKLKFLSLVRLMSEDLVFEILHFSLSEILFSRKVSVMLNF